MEIIMLNEERKNEIEKAVNEKGSVSVHELMQLFDASESTIRRDLNDMAAKKLLIQGSWWCNSLNSEPEPLYNFI